MSDLQIDTDSSAGSKLADLERRVHVLEAKVAAIPDTNQIEERVAQRVKASIPPPGDPSQAPSFQDIELPIPNMQAMIATAQSTWTLIEMLGELKMLFWTLVDRRYHMAWMISAWTTMAATTPQTKEPPHEQQRLKTLQGRRTAAQPGAHHVRHRFDH